MLLFSCCVICSLAIDPWEAPSDRPRIAHVGIAVADLEAALAFYRDVLGIVPASARSRRRRHIVSLPLGDSEVELLAPLAPDSRLASSWPSAGPGIHHICYRVADLDAALERAGPPDTVW